MSHRVPLASLPFVCLLVAAGCGALDDASLSTSAATTCSNATLEAENTSVWRHTTGGTAGDGWNIWSNGSISTSSYDFATASVRVDVVAKATLLSDGVAANLVLKIGGVQVGRASVTATSYTTFSFNYTPPAAGVKSIEIDFTNDAFISSTQDRNLIVDKVVITCTGANGGGGTGGAPSGGAGGSGGTTGAGGAALSCSGTLSGGTQHSSSNAQGTAAGLSWSIWSNGTGGSITTYSLPAFTAAWNNSGDFLARMGLEWGSSGRSLAQLGTVAAKFAETKSGTAGGFSYVGVYGWSVNPCIEWYIIDDSYGRMPVNPGNTINKGTVTIDGSPYTLYTRPTSGTGGSRCPGVSSWTQFYSVRQTARQCGQISVSDHFKAWAAAGMTLGSVLEAKVLIEVGGGIGSIDFTTANVTAQ
jgi:endo-1,4-beta-xylanase